MGVEAQHREAIVQEIEQLRPAEEASSETFIRFIERIGRPDLITSFETEMIVSASAEFLLPGMSGDGGLGALERDQFLQAVALGMPVRFFGLLYEKRKVQRIYNDGKGHSWQEIEYEPFPSPEEMGYKRVRTLKVTVNGAYGPDCEIPVYLHPLSTERTKLYALQVKGAVYPGQNNSDARMWNNVVLGIGQQQILEQLKDQGEIQDIAFIHTNESAMVIGALAMLDFLTDTYMREDGLNAHEAYARALAEIQAKDILTNHTLVPAAEATYNWGQFNAFIASNLRNPHVKTVMERFIAEHNGHLRFLDLALYLAGTCNGVSVDHARRTYEAFWGSREIAAVTNGIYMEGWAPQVTAFLKTYGIIDEFGLPKDNYIESIQQLPKDAMLKMKQSGVDTLIAFLLDKGRLDQFGNSIDLPQNAIIIGDARRFAWYKRRWMMFKNPERLQKILREHPEVHIFISGKAHPEDSGSMTDLMNILKFVADHPAVQKQIHVVPDWEPIFAAKLFAACHVWLNSPRVGYEACGTSGMKAGLNMALLVSTADGFFAELKRRFYYAIRGDTDTEAEYESYYRELEQAIRDAKDPDRWYRAVKHMWKGLLPIVSGARMLAQYIYLGKSTKPLLPVMEA